MKNIKNIIFDLGGVVIDLKRENAVEALKKLGIADADNLLGLYRQDGPFLDLETGHATAAEFFDTLRTMADNDISDAQFQNAFNSFLVGLPEQRLAAIRSLRKEGYKLYVISNTNPVMYNSWIAENFRKEGLSVNDYFDGIVTSFQELCCKPDPEIFRILLQRYNLSPAESLMLDDSAANCKAAESVGMKSIQIDNTSSDNVLNIIEQLISK